MEGFEQTLYPEEDRLNNWIIIVLYGLSEIIIKRRVMFSWLGYHLKPESAQTSIPMLVASVNEEY